MPEQPGTIAVVVKGWPRLSETFIAREVRALEARGLDLALWSLRHPTDRKHHALIDAIGAPVAYLPEYLHQEPARVWRGWRRARRLPGYRAARAQWLRDLARDLTPNRVRRFGQALVLAAELPAQTRHLHAQFLHTPTSVSRYAAMMRGLSFSVSAHAKDIWTTPDWDKREKLQDARFAVTCTRVGFDHLNALAPGRVDLVHHGLDATDYPDPGPRAAHDGPVWLLAVGRAVPKKGFDSLIPALTRLRGDWRLTHIGGGPELAALKTLAQQAGLGDRIEFRGSQTQDQVLEAYRAADVFVLPARVAPDGDRDGLPNVLVEAASQRLALVATRVGAIEELIQEGETGLLVPSDDPPALAAALQRLMDDAGLRRRLGDAAAARVAERFVFTRGIDRLMAHFATIG